MPCGYTDEEINDPTLNSIPMYKPAKPEPAPNYFGQLPPPQRGGGEEEDAAAAAAAKHSNKKMKSCAVQSCKKFSTLLSNRSKTNQWICT